MKKSILKNETKVIVSNARLSYANIFEPTSFEGQEPKYSVSVLIPKSDHHTIDLIIEAINNAQEQGKKNKWNGKVPNGANYPLHDGDEGTKAKDPVYAGHMYFNASSKNAPGVVGKERDRATGKAIPLGEDEVYSGCYANVSVNFYPYKTGRGGVGAGLQNIQKEADGERLSGKSSAESDFDFEDVDSDDDFLE